MKIHVQKQNWTSNTPADVMLADINAVILPLWLAGLTNHSSLFVLNDSDDMKHSARCFDWLVRNSILNAKPSSVL